MSDKNIVVENADLKIISSSIILFEKNACGTLKLKIIKNCIILKSVSQL